MDTSPFFKRRAKLENQENIDSCYREYYPGEASNNKIIHLSTASEGVGMNDGLIVFSDIANLLF